MPRPSAKYFPVRSYLSQSISFLSYDHRAFPLFVYFLVIKFAIGMFTCIAHFDRRVRIYIATRFFQFASAKEPFCDPRSAGRLIPVLHEPSHMTLL